MSGTPDRPIDPSVIASLAAQLADADQGLAGVVEAALVPLREVVLGHRAAFIEAGVHPSVADEMAADAHRYLTSILLGLAPAGDEDEGPGAGA